MSKLTRTDAALRLVSYASSDMRLSDQETAAALAVAAAYVADSPENLLSVIQLMIEARRIMVTT